MTFSDRSNLIAIYRWIDGDTGRRSDVPHHFIYNQEHNKNLVIFTGQKVKRVIFE